MAYEDRTIWGIHGGRTGDADTLFLKKKRVALGWQLMPDLTTNENCITLVACYSEPQFCSSGCIASSRPVKSNIASTEVVLNGVYATTRRLASSIRRISCSG